MAPPEACPHHEAIVASDQAQWGMIRQLGETLSAMQQAQAGINLRLENHLTEDRLRIELTKKAADDYLKHARKSLPAIVESALYKTAELGLVALLAWLVITAAKAIGVS